MYGETYGSKPGELVDSDDPRQFVLKENSSKWELVNLTTNQSFISDAKIGDGNQQLFEDFGFSIEVNQLNPPHINWQYETLVDKIDDISNSNGLISSFY